MPPVVERLSQTGSMGKVMANGIEGVAKCLYSVAADEFMSKDYFTIVSLVGQINNGMDDIVARHKGVKTSKISRP